MKNIRPLVLAVLASVFLAGPSIADDPYFRIGMSESGLTANPGDPDANPPTANVNATVDEPVNINPAALTSAPAGATWSIASGSLPPGLQLNSTTGAVTGSPDAAGSWSVQLIASNGSASASVTLAISVAAADPVTTISLASTSQLSGTVGEAFSYDFNQHVSIANGAPTLSWSSSDLAVPGLSLGSFSGILSGTPTADGTYSFNVTASAPSDPDAVPGVQTYSIEIETAAGPVVLTGVVQMVQGTSHACVLLTGGVVKCWGANNYGQLGDGTTVAKTVPTVIPALAGATAISGAGDTTCAIIGGGAKCWGSGLYWNLGDGSYTDNLVPTDVTNMTSGVTRIAMGAMHGCAQKGTQVWCWGNGGSGQLGNGQKVTSGTPVQVHTSSLPAGTIADLKVGYASSCLVLYGNGFMYCWGRSAEGDIGQGAGQTADITIPDASGSFSGSVTKIQLGQYFGCGMVPGSGYVLCFGKSNLGQTGRDSVVVSHDPFRVYGSVVGVTDFMVGNAHACAVGTFGTACWGSNSHGQLGVTGVSSTSTPRFIPSLGPGVVTKLFGGGNQTCAVLAAGGTKCWGANGSNQLSDGTATNRFTPVDMYDGPST